MKKLLYIIIPIIGIIWLSTGWLSVTQQFQETCDYDSIVSRGKLVVATHYNATDYFIYKGEPKGFQYELIEELGNYLGMKVEIIVNNDPVKNIRLLKNGDVDIVASSWGYENVHNNKIICSEPILETELVLVQRKPTDLILGNGHVQDSIIRNLNELEGKSIYLPIKTVEVQLLMNIQQVKSEKLKVYYLPQYSQENLVELVSKGSIDFTVCNNILANSLKTSYPELDFETVIKKAEPVVWNFRTTSPLLKEKVDHWFKEISGSTRFAILTNKYFNNKQQWFPAENKFNPSASGSLSVYDDLIKKYSQDINWDWRLLASLIYQESRFNPGVRSRRGAWGLMQMMPTTQSYFGIDTTASPEMQIRAGVRYIKFLDNAFANRISDPKERIHFILASYNIGPGHILDAQKIALKVGKNPQKWFNNVDSCLLSKSQPQHYTDPDILHGYCKGVETYNFVSEILNRYHHYRNILRY